MLKTYYYSIVDIVPLQKKTHRDSSNTFTKDCMIKKKATRDVKKTTWKANQTNYYEASISCLYLIN